MKFREGGSSELHDLVKHGEEFWTHTTYFKRGREYNQSAVAVLCANLMLQDNGFIVVMLDEEDKCQGFGLVVVAPFVFDPSYKAALELAYYIAPKHRGKYGVRLMQEMEKTAKRYGAEFMSMITMEDSNPEAAARVYNKLGYTKNEVVYTKEL